MSRSVIDLAQAGVVLPDRIAVDANVLVTRFIAPSAVTPAYVARRVRVRAFFKEMRTQRTAGLVPVTAFAEFIHVAIKVRYKADLQQFASAVGGRKSWEMLFKARPDLLEGYARDFGSFLRGFASVGVAVLQPDDVAPRRPTQRVER